MSDFNKNILVLLSGTTIAQALPIVLMPVLTRLYTPAEFGVLAIFVAITTILGAIANARYELALTLPETDDEAITVAALGLAIATGFSLVLLIPFVLFNGAVTALFDNTAISTWLYFVPLVVWLIGLFNVFNFLNTRLKKYKDIAISHVYRSVAMVSVQLILGFLKAGSLGLVTGQIFAQIAVVLRVGYTLPVKPILRRIASLTALKAAAARFRRFFIFMLPATLMNSLSNNFISLYLPIAFSMSTLGFYSLAQRALGAPSALIGSSIGQVYMQEASQERINTGVISKSFDSAFKKLISLCLLIFTPLYFFVEELFSFVFGADWLIAGTFTKILIPYFAINFVVSSLSVTDSIMEKQYYYSLFNVVLLSSVGIFVFIDHSLDINLFLSGITIVLSLVYLAYLALMFFISRGRL